MPLCLKQLDVALKIDPDALASNRCCGFEMIMTLRSNLLVSEISGLSAAKRRRTPQPSRRFEHSRRHSVNTDVQLCNRL